MYMSNLPAGNGLLDLAHYGQLIALKEPTFRRFDYQEIENVRRYGQSAPPDYDLKNLKFPIAVLSASKDKLADP